MTKSDLVEVLASRANLTYAVADKIINEIFDSMTDTLVAGDRIEIRGFGSFEIREYEGYTWCYLLLVATVVAFSFYLSSAKRINDECVGKVMSDSAVMTAIQLYF